jgi:hypothetical protein
MARSPSHPAPADAPRVSFWARLKEIDLFFEGRGREHKTLRRLVANLEKAKIPYAIIGGMAVNAHHHRQTTHDVDVLLTPEGFAEFRRRYVPKSYGPVPGRSRRFLDRRHKIIVDVRLAGSFPRVGGSGPVVFPDPAEVSEIIGEMRVVNLVTLVHLKLAARRYRDLGDVGWLIRSNNLDDSLNEHLHPSVRGDFIKCLEENRRDDEFEARE